MNISERLADAQAKFERIASSFVEKRGLDSVTIIAHIDGQAVISTGITPLEDRESEAVNQTPESIGVALASLLLEWKFPGTYKLTLLEGLAHAFRVMTPEIQFEIRKAWMQQHQEEQRGKKEGIVC